MEERKVTAGTLARTVILLLALCNQLLSLAGLSVLPIADEQIETLVTTGWTVVAALVAWWKNNSFTRAAMAGDAVKEHYQQREG